MKKTVDNTPSILKLDRRSFLKNTSIGFTGIMLGMQIGCGPREKEFYSDAAFKPNVYLNIKGNGEVVIVAHRSEMGQGVRTGLPLIVADELEVDWQKVKIEQAVGNEEVYGNQNTDGSFSIRMFYMPMRKAGAVARMMLEQAAANQWHVEVATCKAKDGEVIHQPSGKKLSFAALAEAASLLELPREEDIRLKPASEFKYIGKGLPIVDLHDMVSGGAVYGMDARVEGMKIAMIQRCPVAGGKVVSVDDSEALKVPGVQKIFTLDSPGFPTNFHNPLGGVVVVADNTWAAMQGRKALKIEWDYGVNAGYDSRKFAQQMEADARRTGNIKREQGEIKKALKAAGKMVEATYSVPHYAHATMEPPCALAKMENGKCEIWAPTQHPQWAKGVVAEALGIEEEDVTIHVTLLGGGFGRKSKPDFVVESAVIAKNCQWPVKLIWTREDDIQHDFYHFNSVQHVKVALGNNNDVLGWNHKTVFPPIGGTASADVKEPSFELGLGFVDFPYNIPAIRLETHEAKAQIRIGWLRSVANIQHAFAIGSMLDEVAEARKVDPIDNALELLGEDRHINFNDLVKDFFNYNEKLEDFPFNTGRLRHVINMVKEKSSWGKDLPSGRGQGFAVHRSFLTYVACVVEVSVDNNGKISIPEVHYAVDCGVPVNPDRVRSQFEGGAIFGTSIALKGQISVKDGQVEQSNFHDYPLARMPDGPYDIQVHLVDSREKPTGVGEPPVPPYIPALCNAIYAATGKRARQLPVSLT
ncbi:MAG: molybdopterin-dependent oxidoreductase [Cytophagales bacterium]|nr:molybdopterin-dependent oxidoreductase [Cytophagales bacterium]